MIHDPRKAMEQLEAQLHAAEEIDDDFERLYSELYKEFGQKPVKEDPQEDMLSDVPVRRIPGPYDEPVSRDDYADHHRSVRKDKDIPKLMLLICLECLGIAGIVAWWVFRLL